MATEVFARTSQLSLISLDAKRSEQLCTGLAGESFQLATRR